MSQDQISDFANDVQLLREDIEEECHGAALNECVEEISQHSNFYGQLFKSEPSIDNNLEVMAKHDEQVIYELNDNYFQSVTKVYLSNSSTPMWLLVTDQEEHAGELENKEESENQDEYEIALQGAFYGIFILLTTLAICLYFPIKRLNIWLSEIEQANKQIGKQNYDFKLSEDKIRPLGQLAKSFNSMAENIKNHVREKNILANAIAHELRTPLTRFRLVLGLLNRQPLDEMGKELLTDLERYTDELETITDDTLRLATLRDNDISVQEIRLYDFLMNLQDKFQSSFPTLTVGISCEAVEIESDADFLQLALDNIISNACHYAQQSVYIKQWHDQRNYYIEISDDGPGIPMEDVEYVQQAFTRLDKSRNRKTGGTGLGLAIVRLAVQRLQGQIKFKDVTTGTLICLTLPLKLPSK